MSRILKSPEAENDLDEIWLYIVPDRKSLFSRFMFSFFDGKAVFKLINYNKCSGFLGMPVNQAHYARFWTHLSRSTLFSAGVSA